MELILSGIGHTVRLEQIKSIFAILSLKTNIKHPAEKRNKKNVSLSRKKIPLVKVPTSTQTILPKKLIFFGKKILIKNFCQKRVE